MKSASLCFKCLSRNQPLAARTPRPGRKTCLVPVPSCRRWPSWPPSGPWALQASARRCRGRRPRPSDTFGHQFLTPVRQLFLYSRVRRVGEALRGQGSATKVGLVSALSVLPHTFHAFHSRGQFAQALLGRLQVQDPGSSPSHSAQDHEDPHLEADAKEGVRLRVSTHALGANHTSPLH